MKHAGFRWYSRLLPTERRKSLLNMCAPRLVPILRVARHDGFRSANRKGPCRTAQQARLPCDASSYYWWFSRGSSQSIATNCPAPRVCVRGSGTAETDVRGDGMAHRHLAHQASIRRDDADRTREQRRHTDIARCIHRQTIKALQAGKPNGPPCGDGQPCFFTTPGSTPRAGAWLGLRDVEHLAVGRQAIPFGVNIGDATSTIFEPFASA